MLRRFVSAAAVLLIIGGFVLAESVTGLITAVAVKDGKITVKSRGKKGGEATEKTIDVSKSKVMFKESKGGKDAVATDAADYDLKKLKSAVEKASTNEKGPKGVFAKIETEGDTTTITLMKGTRGKGKGNKSKE